MTAQPSLFDSLKSDLQIAFEAFDAANPAVYRLFCRFTHELIQRGRRNYSADAILHRVRWETALQTVDDDFKVNNSFVSGYARKFMADYPAHKGFFQLRKSVFDRQDAA